MLRVLHSLPSIDAGQGSFGMIYRHLLLLAVGRDFNILLKAGTSRSFVVVFLNDVVYILSHQGQIDQHGLLSIYFIFFHFSFL